MKVDIPRILVEYDCIPQLILATDCHEHKYLSILEDFNESEAIFLGVLVSSERFDEFMNGNIELRTIYTEPESDDSFFTIRVTDNKNATAEPYTESIEEDMLPNEGFFMDGNNVIV